MAMATKTKRPNKLTTELLESFLKHPSPLVKMQDELRSPGVGFPSIHLAFYKAKLHKIGHANPTYNLTVYKRNLKTIMVHKADGIRGRVHGNRDWDIISKKRQRRS